MSQFNIQPGMIFPSTKMDSVNKLISEGSLTRLINKLIDTDSYIVPPADVDLTAYTNTDYGTMIEVTSPEQCDMEFLIHGYYFNMGLIRDISKYAVELSKSETDPIQGNFFITAGIDIDPDLDNDGQYPEMFGEDLIKRTNKQTLDVIPDSKERRLPNISDFPELKDKPISKIIFYKKTSDAEWEVVGYGSYDATGDIQKPVGLEFESAAVYSIEIEYKNYSSLITFYLVPEGKDVTEVRLDIDKNTASNYIYPDNYESYYLQILYVDKTDSDNPKVFLPLNNFAKFEHQSIASIDGGII